MAKRQKYIEPSNEQLRRYVAGELSPAEQYHVEKAALQNKQIDDMLEGLQALKNANVDEETALKELSQKLNKRIRKNEQRLVPFYYASAAVIIIAAGLGRWLTQKEELSMKTSSTIALQQTPPVIQPESAPVAADNQPPQLLSPKVATPEPSPPITASPPQPQADAVAESTPQVEKPAPTLVLEEKRSESPVADAVIAPAGARPPDSAQHVVAKTKAPDNISAAPVAALAKRSAFGAGKAGVFTLRGKVLTDNQQALAGVVLQLKNQSSGVSTDAGGNFVLPNVRKGDEITISSVGYEQTQLTVKDSVITPIVLKEDRQALSEIVVVAGQESSKIKTREAGPKNGWKKYKKYLENAAKAYIAQHPQSPRGDVSLSFVLTTSGEPGNFEKMKKADAGLFEEAIRIIKNGDSWEPSIRNGQKVPDKILIRVRFE
ncbi:carboxypeptidase-like regulatory domain-containing protein [Runella sp.]|uniref:carboxypeptidase-like regulatory domain-containing protein n=1 Tax=Runella sp. TaxID=1960881 RepID=UPI003D143361